VAEDGRVRIEVAFDGGQALAALVSVPTVEALERALADGDEGTFMLEAEDGHYVVALRRVVFVKRFARESRVGFGAI
jgi:hypothetical protein